MLKDFLSEDTFRKGIIRYLKKFSYRNAKNDDLWHSLSNVSHQLSYRMTKNILQYYSCRSRKLCFILRLSPNSDPGPGVIGQEGDYARVWMVL